MSEKQDLLAVKNSKCYSLDWYGVGENCFYSITALGSSRERYHKCPMKRILLEKNEKRREKG